jgi:hypothetical protein
MVRPPFRLGFAPDSRGTAAARDLALVLGVLLAVYLVGLRLELMEKLTAFASRHERLELDEWIPALLVLSFAVSFYSWRRWQEVLRSEHELVCRTQELEKTLQELHVLRGIIPICASCKKVRDERGYWTQVKSYISLHSEAEFSHSLCQECSSRLYPDYQELRPNDASA